MRAASPVEPNAHFELRLQKAVHPTTCLDAAPGAVSGSASCPVRRVNPVRPRWLVPLLLLAAVVPTAQAACSRTITAVFPLPNTGPAQADMVEADRRLA
jgi:hypothetical protein